MIDLFYRVKQVERNNVIVVWISYCSLTKSFCRMVRNDKEHILFHQTFVEIN